VTALVAANRAAAQARFALLIHMRTQRVDYGAPDVKRFINDVLPAAGNTPVQIAHAGGWGGIDPATLSVLGAFADAIEANPERFRHVWFDLSGVWTDESSAPTSRHSLCLSNASALSIFSPTTETIWPTRTTGFIPSFRLLSSSAAKSINAVQTTRSPTKVDIDDAEANISQVAILKAEGWSSMIHIDHPERYFRQYVPVRRAENGSCTSTHFAMRIHRPTDVNRW